VMTIFGNCIRKNTIVCKPVDIFHKKGYNKWKVI